MKDILDEMSSAGRAGVSFRQSRRGERRPAMRSGAERLAKIMLKATTPGHVAPHEAGQLTARVPVTSPTYRRAARGQQGAELVKVPS